MKGSRRHFLLGSGSAIALGSFPFALSAAQSLPDKALSGLAPQAKGLVVYRKELLPSRAYAAVLANAGMHSVGLSADPVLQWRQSLAELVSRTEGPVVGLTDWADYQLLRGLGAELRRHARQERRHLLHTDSAEAEAMALALADLGAVGSGPGAESPALALYGSSLFSWELV